MNDLISLLRQFRNRRVLVVGDGGWDNWYQVERGRDFEDGTLTINVPRWPSDVTLAMASFVGLQCDMLCAAVTAEISKCNINTRYIGEGVRVGIRPEPTSAHFDLSRALSRIPSHNAVIISDYNKGVCTPETCRAVIDAANEHGIPVLVDPARGADWAKYAGATCIKYSDGPEANWLDAQGVDFWTSPQWPVLVETHGAHGMGVIRKGDNWEWLAPYTPSGPFIDAIGCGDICAAVLGLTLAVGAPLLDGCRLAAVVAGMKTQYRGCRAITAEEVERELAAQTKAATG